MPGKNKPVAKKHKFVKDGLFYAELNTLLAKELAEDGYGGCEVRVTPTRTEIVILATKTTNVTGPNGRRVKELTALIQKRFNFKKDQIILFVQMVRNKGLSALSQAEAVRYRLFEGLSVRRAAYAVLKFIMDRGAKGVEVTVSGKLRGQRAKAMKFRDGYMVHAGDAVNYYIDCAVKHVHLRQGVIGIKVKIMLPHDPKGEAGPARNLPDVITIHPVKELESSHDAGTGGGGDGGNQPYDIRNQAKYAPNIPSAQEIHKPQQDSQQQQQHQQQQQRQQQPQQQRQQQPQQQRQQQPQQQRQQQQQQQRQQQQSSQQQHQQQQHQQQQQQHEQQFDQYNQNDNTQFQQYGQQAPQYADYNQFGGQGQQQNYNYDYQNQNQNNFNQQQHQGGRGRGGQGFYNQNNQYYNQNNQY